MSDTEEDKSNSIPATSTMATEVTNLHQSQSSITEPAPAATTTEVTKKLEKMNISLSIWPPTQRTRDAVINRLIETLSSPSILSNRYGSLSIDEASSTAKFIEDEAFVIANAAASSSSSSSDQNSINNNDDDGIEILQIYSKEISKRMLEAVKSKAAAATTANGGDSAETMNRDAKEESIATSGGDEISSAAAE